MTDSERNVLACVLGEPSNFWRVASRISADDFSSETFSELWDCIESRMTAGKPADAVSIGDVYPRFQELAMDLACGFVSAAQLEHHAELIRSGSEVRRLQRAGRRIATLSGDDAFGRAQQLLLECQPRTEQRVRCAKDGLREMVRVLEKRLQNRDKPVGLSWGIEELDALYRPEPEHLVVVAARPKMGKTALTMQCAIRAAVEGRRVFCASLEMSLRDLTERAVSHVGRFPLQWIKKPAEAPDTAMARITAASEQVVNLPLLIDDTPNMTPSQVVAQATQLHMQEPLGAVVIDHLGLLSLRGENEVRELGVATKAFKGLAKTLKCPVLLVVQLNRDVEKRADREPQPSDLRGSGRIEEDADAVVMLYREMKANQGLAKALLRMNRHGETGEVVMREALARMAFEDTSDEWTYRAPPAAVRDGTFASRYSGGAKPAAISRPGEVRGQAAA